MHKENTEAPGVWTKVPTSCLYEIRLNWIFVWNCRDRHDHALFKNDRNTHLKLNCVFHFFFHTLLSTWRPLFNRKKPRSSPIPSQYIQARLVSPSTWMKDVMNRLSPPPQYKWVALSRLRKMWRTAHTTPLGYLNLPPLGKRGICSVKIRWDWFVWFNTWCPYNVFYQLI